MASNPCARRLRLFRPRYTLRGLLLLTAFTAVWTNVAVRRAREQQTAVRLIREQGGHVCYDFQEQPPGSGRYDHKAKSHLPAWLLARLSEDFFSDVVFAELGGNPTRDDKIPVASPQSAVQHLEGLRNLQELQLDEDATDESLRHAGKLRKLESLGTWGDATKVTDAGIAYLAGLRRLKTLVLPEAAITDESLEVLGRLRFLEHLRVGGRRITCRGLVHLRGLKAMQQLDLSPCAGVTDEGLASLSGLVRLNELGLSDANITSAGLEHLKQLNALRYLDLSNNCELADDAMPIIAQFTALEELRLTNAKVTSNGMRRLARLKKLRFLDLSGNRGVTDEGVAWLSNLKSLEELKLSNTRVSSTAIKRLAGLSKLSFLDLSENAQISQEAPLYLAKLVSLQVLDLHHTNVALTRHSAACLSPLTSLYKVRLTGTGSDCRSVDAALPNCVAIGARSTTRDDPGIRERQEYESLLRVLEWLENRRRDSEYEKAWGESPWSRDKHVRDFDFIPSPELLPPNVTLDRMLALINTAEIDRQLAEQRSVLKGFADWIRSLSSPGNSPYDEAKRLWQLVQSNAALERLYTAAIDLALADALAENIEYLDDERKSWALTDVEQQEYREASESLDACLGDASQQLGLNADRPSDVPGAAITRIWKATQRVETQPKGVVAGGWR